MAMIFDLDTDAIMEEDGYITIVPELKEALRLDEYNRSVCIVDAEDSIIEEELAFSYGLDRDTRFRTYFLYPADCKVGEEKQILEVDDTDKLPLECFPGYAGADIYLEPVYSEEEQICGLLVFWVKEVA